MRRRSIIQRESRCKAALNQSHQHQPPLLLTIIMRTARTSHKSEPVVEMAKWHAEQTRTAVLDPANRARADSRHHDSRVPCRPQYFVESMQSPHREHVRAAAAADVDDVLRHHEL